VFRHLLPFPIDPGQPGMPRIALEAIVRAPFGGVRIITTHLEYYGTLKRTAQVEALRAIYAEGSGHARLGQIVETDDGQFHDYPRPAATIITGDFNLEPDDRLHARMVRRSRRHAAAVDAWEAAHPGIAHPATFKIYEKETRRTGAALRFHLRVRRPGAAPQVDSHRPGNWASDHQPVLAEFD
jgi:endonuclease/exonuclease/phosphatase family metal-dependent hydrolase